MTLIFSNIKSVKKKSTLYKSAPVGTYHYIWDIAFFP